MNILTRIINLFRRRRPDVIAGWPLDPIKSRLSAIQLEMSRLQFDLAKAKRLKLRRVHIYARLEALRNEQLRLEALRNG